MEGKGMRLRGNLFEADFINPSQAVLEDTKAQVKAPWCPPARPFLKCRGDRPAFYPFH